LPSAPAAARIADVALPVTVSVRGPINLLGNLVIFTLLIWFVRRVRVRRRRLQAISLLSQPMLANIPMAAQSISASSTAALPAAPAVKPPPPMAQVSNDELVAFDRLHEEGDQRKLEAAWRDYVSKKRTEGQQRVAQGTRAFAPPPANAAGAAASAVSKAAAASDPMRSQGAAAVAEPGTMASRMNAALLEQRSQLQGAPSPTEAAAAEVVQAQQTTIAPAAAASEQGSDDAKLGLGRPLAGIAKAVAAPVASLKRELMTPLPPASPSTEPPSPPQASMTVPPPAGDASTGSISSRREEWAVLAAKNAQLNDLIRKRKGGGE